MVALDSILTAAATDLKTVLRGLLLRGSLVVVTLVYLNRYRKPLSPIFKKINWRWCKNTLVADKGALNK